MARFLVKNQLNSTQLIRRHYIYIYVCVCVYFFYRQYNFLKS
jgi:hypothetical protein